MSEMSKESWYINRHWTWQTCRWCANVKNHVQNKKQWLIQTGTDFRWLSEHIQVVKRMYTRSRQITRYRYSLTSSDHYLNYVRNNRSRVSTFFDKDFKMLQAVDNLRLLPNIGSHEIKYASCNVMWMARSC